MKKINLKKIIEVKRLDLKNVADELFPGHKYPKLALDRVLSGKGVLDADQISRFSFYSGIPIEQLWDGAGWRSTMQGQKHILFNGAYRAELNTTTWTTKLFHKDSLFHEFVIHSSSIGLGDYMKMLNTEISKNK